MKYPTKVGRIDQSSTAILDRKIITGGSLVHDKNHIQIVFDDH